MSNRLLYRGLSSAGGLVRPWRIVATAGWLGLLFAGGCVASLSEQEAATAVANKGDVASQSLGFVLANEALLPSDKEEVSLRELRRRTLTRVGATTAALGGATLVLERTVIRIAPGLFLGLTRSAPQAQRGFYCALGALTLAEVSDVNLETDQADQVFVPDSVFEGLTPEQQSALRRAVEEAFLAELARRGAGLTRDRDDEAALPLQDALGALVAEAESARDEHDPCSNGGMGSTRAQKVQSEDGTLLLRPENAPWRSDLVKINTQFRAYLAYVPICHKALFSLDPPVRPLWNKILVNSEAQHLIVVLHYRGAGPDVIAFQEGGFRFLGSGGASKVTMTAGSAAVAELTSASVASALALPVSIGLQSTVSFPSIGIPVSVERDGS